MNDSIDDELEALTERIEDVAKEAGFVVLSSLVSTPHGGKLELLLHRPTSSNSLENSVEYLLVQEEFSEIIDRQQKRRRKYRKRDEMPDPSQAPNAEVNRRERATKIFNARIDPTVIEHIEAFREASGLSKREIVEAALMEFLASHRPK